MSTGSKVFLVVLVLLFGAIGGALWYVNDILEGEPDGEPVTVTVESGATMQSIGDELYEEGVIANTTAFRLLARNSEAAGNIQPGEYEFRTDMAIEDAIAVLEAGPAVSTVREELTFGVAEGLSIPLTLDEIAKDLAPASQEMVEDGDAGEDEPADDGTEGESTEGESTEGESTEGEGDEGEGGEAAEDDTADPGLSPEAAAVRAELVEVLQAHLDGDGPLELPDWLPAPNELEVTGPHPFVAFEGVLFPNTWRIFSDEEDLAVAAMQRMVDQLVSVMDSIDPEQVAAAEEAGIGRYEAMIVASLIERETRVDEERPLVASVIYNRLEEGMALQIDASVLFALGQWKERVLTEDTDVESPWNTYQNAGLPPTPISGFGEASLRAAFAPEESDFLYYVVSPACDGTHNFAETLDEHNRNVQEFRDSGRCEGEG